MKALTIKQPWANLIVDGFKDIENRTWRTNYRGRVYIHAGASKAFSSQDVSLYLHYDQFYSIPDNTQNDLTQGIWPLSAIVGEVDIIDCVIGHPSIWAEKTEMPAGVYMGEKIIWNWVLANPIKYYQPILNVKGALSFWQPDPALTNVH